MTLAKAAQIWPSNATKTSSENCRSTFRSVTRNLARALSPHSRGCWSSVHSPRPFTPVPLAACGKVYLEYLELPVGWRGTLVPLCFWGDEPVTDLALRSGEQKVPKWKTGEMENSFSAALQLPFKAGWWAFSVLLPPSGFCLRAPDPAREGTSRATHAHPTSPRSTGFCAIWGCISSSSRARRANL